MRNNSKDRTVERRTHSGGFLVELVKAKKHPRFRFVQDFYPGTSRQTFEGLTSLCCL